MLENYNQPNVTLAGRLYEGGRGSVTVARAGSIHVGIVIRGSRASHLPPATIFHGYAVITESPPNPAPTESTFLSHNQLRL